MNRARYTIETMGFMTYKGSFHHLVKPLSLRSFINRRSMSISVPTSTSRCQWRAKQNTKIGTLPKICRNSSNSKPVKVMQLPMPRHRANLEHFQRDLGGPLARLQMPKGSEKVSGLLLLEKDEGRFGKGYCPD